MCAEQSPRGVLHVALNLNMCAEQIPRGGHVAPCTPCWCSAPHAFWFGFILFRCWFFGPVDARETCFGLCVVAAAYTAVID